MAKEQTPVEAFLEPLAKLARKHRDIEGLVFWGGDGWDPSPSEALEAEALANAALRGLDEVVAREGDRGTALRLLAADAALTYAFQAAAELGEDVSALAERVGLGGELGRRIRSAGASVVSAREPE